MRTYAIDARERQLSSIFHITALDIDLSGKHWYTRTHCHIYGMKESKTLFLLISRFPKSLPSQLRQKKMPDFFFCSGCERIHQILRIDVRWQLNNSFLDYFYSSICWQNHGLKSFTRNKMLTNEPRGLFLTKLRRLHCSKLPIFSHFLSREGKKSSLHFVSFLRVGEKCVFQPAMKSGQNSPRIKRRWLGKGRVRLPRARWECEDLWTLPL